MLASAYMHFVLGALMYNPVDSPCISSLINLHAEVHSSPESGVVAISSVLRTLVDWIVLNLASAAKIFTLSMPYV